MPENNHPQKPTPCADSTSPGVDDFIHRIGLDNLDSMGLHDVIEIAFLGGRTYETKQALNELKSLNVAATRRQAD